MLQALRIPDIAMIMKDGGTIEIPRCDAYQLEKLAVTNNRCRTYAMEALYVGKTVCKQILVDTITEHGGTIE